MERIVQSLPLNQRSSLKEGRFQYPRTIGLEPAGCKESPRESMRGVSPQEYGRRFAWFSVHRSTRAISSTERLTTMRSCIRIGEPRRQSFRIARLYLVDLFAAPRPVIYVSEFNRHNRVSPNAFSVCCVHTWALKTKFCYREKLVTSLRPSSRLGPKRGDGMVGSWTSIR
jgi:hypothetical protein